MKSFNEWLEKRDPGYYEESWKEKLGRGVSAVKAASDKVPGWVKTAGMVGAGALLGGGVGAGMAAAGMAPAIATGLVGGAGAITGAKYAAHQDAERREKKADVRRKRPGFTGW